ncbi:VOC family protein [Streptomyces sp. NPDC051993]|uniref:VOC family protein n=2 Tax=unclassified Streptomyces TaxID=2593676 RepID=UPI00343ABCE3
MNIRTKARLPAGAEAHDTALPAAGMRLASAVLYVSDLGESIRFYRELLDLQAVWAHARRPSWSATVAPSRRRFR